MSELLKPYLNDQSLHIFQLTVDILILWILVFHSNKLRKL